MSIYINQVCGTRALLTRIVTVAVMGICILLARSCIPAYANAQSKVIAQDAAVADYSERDIADLYISNETYREVLVRMVLTRIAIAESGFNTTDAAAVLHLLKRRAEVAGIPIESMARRYSSSSRVRPTARLRWVLEIEPSCSEPDSWPSNLKWSGYEDRCLAMFALVDRFLRNEVADPCAGQADHFGNAEDHARARRAGWRRISCGAGVANRFYKERGGVVDALKARGAR